MMMNPYQIGQGPGYQPPPQVWQGTYENYVLAKLKKNKRKGERQVKRQWKLWKGSRTVIRVGTLNIGTMTVRGRELADMMDERNLNVLCF